ncbi:MAG: DUF1223 domain-containing protein [Alphaproteobacteria bacterium]|nr:DUF1223 domain-containing protein [Alphaproteobacteria bacterium]MBV9063072.1 DUF1223 domain-containing protein [Alphaproteobacteria bacterium]
MFGRTSSGAAIAGTFFFVVSAAGAQPPDAKPRRPVVVELYTSQGCSSCPPADALLGQLAIRKDVLAMSLPVTYWDMLGWRDTLADEANTKRQKAYAKELGRGGVYTPQMIVDGANDVVGSREQSVQATIAARAGDMQTIPVNLEANHQQVQISVGQAQTASPAEATIWLFGLLPQATVKIGDGENGGRTITYHNVVRQIRAVGMWKGQPVTVSVPRGEAGRPHDGIAVLVQQGGYGRVLGAASIEHPNFYMVR